VVLSSGPVNVRGRHADGTDYSVTLEPSKPDGEKKTRRQIGVGPAYSLRVRAAPDDPQRALVIPGSPFDGVEPPLKPGDVVRSINGQPVETYSQFESLLMENRDQEVKVEIEERADGDAKPGATRTVTVPPQPFRTLGLQMDIGKITAVRPGSPAAAIGLQAGDKLVEVDGRKIGDEIDPLRLPELFYGKIGQPVPIGVSREGDGSEPEKLELTVTPAATPGWVEHPVFLNSPISVTSIGLAYHLIPTVFRVDPDGPGAKAGIKERDTITKVELVLQPDLPAEYKTAEPIPIEIGEDNWAFAIWQLQENPVASVRVTLKASEGQAAVTHELTPVAAADWFVPTDRGLITAPKTSILKADNVSDALALGWRHTTGSMKDIYLTLRGLLVSDISTKELHGPIRIATVAYDQAGRGLSEFVLFLGLISINLAVINFLPIPVLDGGHMMFLLWEGLARRRPNERVVAAAPYCGLFFVLGLMMFVITRHFKH
jgi:regulator of sigma E protease